MKGLFTFIIATIVVMPSASQDIIEEKRLEIATDFLKNLKDTRQTNELIMKTFTAEGTYFKVDTVKRMADQWINAVRTFLQGVDKNNLIVCKYLPHEDEFMVNDNSPGLPFDELTPQKLKFSLDTLLKENLYVNKDDLYVIQVKNEREHCLFILFNSENRIVSFSHMRWRSKIAMWQW